jgi:acetoin utilization protein AcuB
MLVGKRMMRHPVIAAPEESLAVAQERMKAGGFRRLPVVKDGSLTGIITDRDVREHAGRLKQTRIQAAMTADPVTVSPETTLEKAAQLLLAHKIGGLPVLEGSEVVGIITTVDILKAFLDVIGANVEDTARIDLLLEGKEYDLAGASRAIVQEGGEILGLGTYRERWGESPVCYLRLRSSDPERLAQLLKEKGYDILGVHP